MSSPTLAQLLQRLRVAWPHTKQPSCVFEKLMIQSARDGSLFEWWWGGGGVRTGRGRSRGTSLRVVILAHQCGVDALGVQRADWREQKTRQRQERRLELVRKSSDTPVVGWSCSKSKLKLEQVRKQLLQCSALSLYSQLAYKVGAMFFSDKPFRLNGSTGNENRKKKKQNGRGFARGGVRGQCGEHALAKRTRDGAESESECAPLLVLVGADEPSAPPSSGT